MSVVTGWVAAHRVPELWGRSMSLFIKAGLWSSGRTRPFDNEGADRGAQEASLSVTMRFHQRD